MNVRRSIFTGVIGGAFFALVTVVVSFIQLRLVMDFLPPTLAGIWFLFVSVGAYIAFWDLGLSPTIARQISFHLGSEQHDERGRSILIANLLATSGYLFRMLALVAFVLAAALGGYLVHARVPQALYPSVAWAWLIFALGGAMNLWASNPFAALYGLGYLGTERLIRSLSLLAGLALTVILLYGGYGIVGLAAAWTAQGFLSRMAARWVMYRRRPDLLAIRGQVQMSQLKEILYPSLKWAAMGLGAILILQTDNAVIALTLGPAAIPNYEAAAKIAVTAMSLALLLITATSPQISRAFAEKKTQLVASLLSQSVRLSVATVTFVVAFVAVFGDQIIAVWLGSQRFVGFPVVWTLLLMTLLETHHVAMATATMATGHVVFARPALLAGILNLAISFVLAQHMGLWGVALGTLIAQVLTNNWYAPYVTLKYFGIPFASHFRTVLAPIVGLLAILMCTNYLLKYALDGIQTLVAITGSLLVSGMIWVVMLYVLMLSAEERGAAKLYVATRLASLNKRR